MEIFNVGPPTGSQWAKDMKNRPKIRRYNLLSLLCNSLQRQSSLKSLLNELACLTVLNTVKRASLFDRDLRVFKRPEVQCECHC